MEKLFSEFTGISSKEWQEKIIKDLKGIDITTLNWNSLNNVTINPFYTSENLIEKPKALFGNSDWDICENIVVNNEVDANKLALKALAKGASGIVFYIFKKINTAQLIANISLEHIYTQFFISNDALHVLSDLQNVYGLVNKYDGKTKCFVTIDPLSMLAYYGEWHQSEEKDLEILKNLKHLSINASLYQEAGANQIHELAITLAHCNEYFNYLNEHNALQEKQIHIGFSIGNDFFAEIAKLRAFRKILTLLQEQYQTNFTIHLHCQTSLLNKSEKDAYNNLLRTTTEAMSAILGGCNSLSIVPYDEQFNETNEFSSRMAINQQHILKDESYLNKVADVAAGSYYIENLTDIFADKSWEIFKTIESKGGYLASLKSHFIQNLISKDFEILCENYKENKQTLIGVTKFVNTTEKAPNRKANTDNFKGKLIPRILPQNIGAFFS